MEQKKRIFVSFGILVALIIAFLVITNTITKYTGFAVTDNSDTNSESCLANQDIKLFINSTNSDDTLKNTGLIDYMEYFKIQNCYINNQPCTDNGITDFPTWIINGKTYTGDITVADLGKYTKCSG
jgi:hypothetical protein